MSDLPQFIPKDGDDVELSGVAVTNVEQADDVLLMSTSEEGLRKKVEGIYRWCSVNFMLFNETKSVVLVFGRSAKKEVFEWGDGGEMAIRDEVTYLGFQLSTRAAARSKLGTGIFRKHYDVKEKAAARIAGAICGVERLTGPLPVAVATRLYMALIDPHLTHGADVVVDNNARAVSKLVEVQKLFIRRTMGLGPRSSANILFTETGLIPLRVRRVCLLLRYILYVLEAPAGLVKSALREAVALDFAGRVSWVTSLRWAVSALPFECTFPDPNGLLRVEEIATLLEEVEGGVGKWLQGRLDANPKLSLLHGRREPDVDGALTVKMPLKLRYYLKVAHPGHRRALTRVLLSEHRYAVEALQWTRPVGRRLCRFCGAKVETVEHLWMWCMKRPELCAARKEFMSDVWRAATAAERARLVELDIDAGAQLVWLLTSRDWVSIVASFAYSIERLVEKVKIPPEPRRRG
ncbi:hypothetical protein DFP72DRAFT_833015 [Ephemerocybe angulata]|uniref:Reverse transcriptase domain-containing protein n=1 Tax=Ephemerocybe angulata TaxID=980116 RepID=A0A8H6LUG8_9AGAR|nr:hypothetical protein DFP72DRAFT_833015 [Tulosesus angulatus]